MSVTVTPSIAANSSRRSRSLSGNSALSRFRAGTVIHAICTRHAQDVKVGRARRSHALAEGVEQETDGALGEGLDPAAGLLAVAGEVHDQRAPEGQRERGEPRDDLHQVLAVRDQLAADTPHVDVEHGAALVEARAQRAAFTGRHEVVSDPDRDVCRGDVRPRARGVVSTLVLDEAELLGLLRHGAAVRLVTARYRPARRHAATPGRPQGPDVDASLGAGDGLPDDLHRATQYVNSARTEVVCPSA